MADVNFRKIDIDIYDEDVLQESDIYETDSRDPGQVLAEAKQKQTAVRSALARCGASFKSPVSDLNPASVN